MTKKIFKKQVFLLMRDLFGVWKTLPRTVYTPMILLPSSGYKPERLVAAQEIDLQTGLVPRVLVTYDDPEPITQVLTFEDRLYLIPVAYGPGPIILIEVADAPHDQSSSEVS